ncbi:MAG: acetate--CoA ligase family protein [Deltaproteobacteria bacterium]|nr:acetate--CoA ligase family protein [Deltaproteobacteria bacterium]
MDFFFDPEGIAVIGATPNPLKGGYAILKNLLTGYKGNIYPVNPRYREIEGLPCYPSVSAIPGHVDLAIVFVPAKFVPATIEDCVAKGIPGVMIESGGFAESGKDGRSLQQSLRDISKKTGIRLWGPNCMGLVDAVRGYAFSFMNPLALQHGLLPGNVSLVVQSGLLSAGFIIDIMSHHITGISKVCSIGNKSDVNECDLLPYLLKDASTEVIGLYLESFSDGRHFIDLCRQSTKPIVVLHGGKSRKGAKAAMSHTASLAGNQKVISGALAQAGVTEARDFHQMIDLCRSLAAVHRPVDRPGRIAILTFSGGAGIIASDFIDEQGLSVAELSPTTKDALERLFPDWMPVSNPVDLWPSIEKHGGGDIDVYSMALSAVLKDPHVDAVLLSTYAGNSRIGLNIKDLAEQTRIAGKPAFVWLLGRREETFRFKKEALSYGIPVFQEVSRAVECLAAVFHQRKPSEIITRLPEKEKAMQIPGELNDLLEKAAGPLDEYISKRILKLHGIPTVEEEIVVDSIKCEEAASRIGFPLVMKGLQQGKVHKTELGLVHLDIANTQAARRSFDSLMNTMNGHGKILVYKQVHGKIELILGLLRDHQFGPCVMLGLGGIMAEILNDAVFAPAPLTEQDALGLISRLREQKILDGFRGEPPVKREELARILIALGNIGIQYPRIHEIDINPLIIGKQGAVAVDATIILK